MNVAQAKQLHLKDLLKWLGHEPVRDDKGEHWYLSPFRKEKEASFKITQDGKGWYDHGAGEGGNILDFVMRYPDRPFQNANDIVSALRALGDLSGKAGRSVQQDSAQGVLWNPTTSVAARNTQHTTVSRPEPKPQPALEITKIQPLQNQALIQYLSRRCIDAGIAERYLQEVYYRWQEKPYFALAFANASGGYELRNPYFQGSYATKDITFLNVSGEGRPSAVALFEGFMDFLSALVHAGQQQPELPVIVLNSASMRHRALAVLQQQEYQTIHLYFDHDKTGHILTAWFQEQLPGREVVDQSELYAGYKDFNDWLMARTKGAAFGR